MTDGKILTVSVMVLGFSGIMFSFLKKREKNIEKKRVINLLGGLFVLIAMFVFGVWLRIPWKPFSIIIVLAMAGAFIENKYISYCVSCGQRRHRLLSKSDFCLKCGKKY